MITIHSPLNFFGKSKLYLNFPDLGGITKYNLILLLNI